MKRKNIFPVLLLVLTGLITISPMRVTTAGEDTMKLTSSGVKDDYWQNRFGKFGKEFIDGVPSMSVPFAIHNPPDGTKSYSAILIDDDAIPVAGHPWIHWLIANLTYENVAENESRGDNDFIQGKNSWGTNYYGGMVPPNAPHRYDLHVYALDTLLDLQEGFSAEEMHEAMKGHILERKTISAMYNN